MKKLLFCSLLLSLSTSLFAYTFDECNTMDLSDVDNVTFSKCSVVLKKGYESQINSFIKKITSDPKADSLLKKNLIISQKLFNSYRDKQCSYFFESAQDAADGSGLISQVFCQAGMSRQRLEFLQKTFD